MELANFDSWCIRKSILQIEHDLNIEYDEKVLEEGILDWLIDLPGNVVGVIWRIAKSIGWMALIAGLIYGIGQIGPIRKLLGPTVAGFIDNMGAGLWKVVQSVGKPAWEWLVKNARNLLEWIADFLGIKELKSYLDKTKEAAEGIYKGANDTINRVSDMADDAGKVAQNVINAPGKAAQQVGQSLAKGAIEAPKVVAKTLGKLATGKSTSGDVSRWKSDPDYRKRFEKVDKRTGMPPHFTGVPEDPNFLIPNKEYDSSAKYKDFLGSETKNFDKVERWRNDPSYRKQFKQVDVHTGMPPGFWPKNNEKGILVPNPEFK